MGNQEDELKEIKSILRSLLISNVKSDVTLKKLNGLYREFEGANIPFADFGFNTLIDFLKSIPDTVRMYNSYKMGELCVRHVETEKSAHVTELIAKQRNPAKRSRISPSHKPRRNYYANYPRVQPSRMTSRPVTSSTSYNYDDKGCYEALQQVLSDYRYKLGTNSHGIRKSELLATVKNQVGKNINYSIQHLNMHLERLKSELNIEQDFVNFKQNNVSKQDQKPTKVPVVDPISVKSYENHYATNHVNNHREVLSNQSSTANLHNYEDHETENNYYSANYNQFDEHYRESQNYFNENSLQEQEIEEEEETYPSEFIDERTRIRLQNLINNHPEGIWCSELPALYKQDYNIELEYLDLGFDNITEFVTAIPDIFTIVEPEGTNRQMILSAKKPYDFSTNSVQQTKTTASMYNYEDYIAKQPQPIPIQLNNVVYTKALVPDNVMNTSETVDVIHVSSLPVSDDDYIEVLVSEIFTPSFFWIQLRENKKKLRLMMSELHENYKNDTLLDTIKVPQVILAPGLNVACVYAKKWHRGIIKKVKPDGYVIVFFCDYGTVKTYNPNEVYYLKKTFSHLPAQAIPCGLHNIRPISGNDWPTNSTNNFVNRVWNIPLIATVSSTDEKNNSVMIALTDTSDDNTDVHINDWMVEKELAIWGKMVHSVPIHTLLFHEESLYLTNNFPEEDCKGQNTSTAIEHHQSLIDIESFIKDTKQFKTEVDNNISCFDSTINDRLLSSQSNNEKAIPSFENIHSNEFVNDHITSEVVNIPEVEQNIFPLFDEATSNNNDTYKNDLPDSTCSYYSNSDGYVDQFAGENDFEFVDGTPTIIIETNIHNKDLQVNAGFLGKFKNSFEPVSTIKPADRHKKENIMKRQLSGETIDDGYCTGLTSAFTQSSLSLVSSINVSQNSLFTVINLTEKCDGKKMHIFYLNDEGWLSASEFVNAFTNLITERILFKLLQVLEYQIRFKNLTRHKNTVLFDQLDESDFEAQRDSNGKIVSNFELILLPLQDFLQVLVNLEFLTAKIVKEATAVIKMHKEIAKNLLYETFHNKILYDALNILLEYKKFRKVKLATN